MINNKLKHMAAVAALVSAGALPSFGAGNGAGVGTFSPAGTDSTGYMFIANLEKKLPINTQRMYLVGRAGFSSTVTSQKLRYKEETSALVGAVLGKYEYRVNRYVAVYAVGGLSYTQLETLTTSTQTTSVTKKVFAGAAYGTGVTLRMPNNSTLTIDYTNYAQGIQSVSLITGGEF